MINHELNIKYNLLNNSITISINIKHTHAHLNDKYVYKTFFEFNVSKNMREREREII